MTRPLAHLMRLTVAAIALSVVPAALPAQQGDALYLVNASDTISVERFLRTSDRLTLDLVIRGANARFTIVVALDSSEVAKTFSYEYRQASAERSTPAAQSGVITFTGDSAIADVRTSGQGTTQRLGSRAGAVPFINPSFALVELTIARARRAGTDSASVPTFLVQGGQVRDVLVTRNGADSVLVHLGGVVARLAVSAGGDILGGVVPTQGLRIVRVRDASESATRMSKPDYSAPADAPYTAEEVVVHTKEGHTLAGTLTLPKGATGPLPAFVTITGSGQQDRDERIGAVKGYRPFRQIADTLGRAGIAVLRMDDRGFGGSGGNALTATSADFANDIRAGLAYLRTRREIDSTRLGLIGHSEGGMIAPMVAAEDASLRGVVLMAGPAKTGRAIIAFQQRYAIDHAKLTGEKRDSAVAQSARAIDSVGKDAPWFRFFLDYDPLVAARRVRMPVLILQGATDQQVTAEQAEALGKAMREAGNTQVTVRVFPQANHLFVQDADGDPGNYAKLPAGAVRGDVLRELRAWAVRTMRATRRAM
jgi:uncharacterized protein